MRQAGTPIERAASTKGRSRSERASARTSLAYQGHQQMASAMPALMRLGPRIATVTMASSSGGNAWNTSVTRISTWSSQPPR